ncbi:MAG: F0F1 ATP synthase subunit B [Actinomycetota bacterium]|nr:F0F1 ATP synthase subunit B [Acidimicrobiia bacterium]MDQ3292879.1 F0F1 ATP synthase subunit B [Actinomycetota bacterium]
MRIRNAAAGGLLAACCLIGWGTPAHAGTEPTETTTAEGVEGTEGEAGQLGDAEGGTEIEHAAEECIHILEDGGTVDDCHEAPSPILPPTNELIWGSISFTILFLLLAKFAYPGIKKGMEARTERIRDDLEGAESAKVDANRVLDEYRAQLADAKAESGRIIEEARQQADAVRREQEARLQTELAGMRSKAAADVESAKVQAVADLRREVAELAIGAAEVVIQRNLEHDTQVQLVDRYIESLNNRSN